MAPARGAAPLALCAAALVLLLLIGAAAPAAARDATRPNPDESYGGCDGGYCAAADPDVEEAFYAAAVTGASFVCLFFGVFLLSQNNNNTHTHTPKLNKPIKKQKKAT